MDEPIVQDSDDELELDLGSGDEMYVESIHCTIDITIQIIYSANVDENEMPPDFLSRLERLEGEVEPSQAELESESAR